MCVLPTLTVDEANYRVVGEIFGRADTQAAMPGLLEVLEDWRQILEDWRPALVVTRSGAFCAIRATCSLPGVPPTPWQRYRPSRRRSVCSRNRGPSVPRRGTSVDASALMGQPAR